FPPHGPGFLIRGNYSNYEDRVNWAEISVETVDGTDCFHFSGEVDMNLAVDDMIANAQKNPGELGTEELRIWDLLRQSKETIELWIGTHDYIVRQEKAISRQAYVFDANEEESWIDSSMLIRYYDFNAPISIEAPEDARPDLMVPTPVPEITITPELR
ncbi:MAG: hypothetical protein PHV74_08500, partial [Dehalococcoidia bacterium]|nr:hypothetical protein [Dehalococcoidia bacterium]